MKLGWNYKKYFGLGCCDFANLFTTIGVWGGGCWIRDSIHVPRNDTLNANEKAVLEMLANSPKITRKAMAQALGLAVITIQRTLDSLAQKGKIERVGANKNGYYRVL